VSNALTPFECHVPQSDVDDVRRRLRATRWPEDATVPGRVQGLPRDEVRELCRYWAESYDWRAAERRLNAWPQVMVDLDGLPIHVVHARSPRPDAIPLVLTHGWPGTVFEFLRVLGPLTDPERHGAPGRPAFHVVCPSLPGYGFSGKPTSSGWGVERIAGAWVELMGRLGYDRFGAFGTDWGTSVTTLMASVAPAHLIGIHLAPPLVAADPAVADDLTPAESAAIDALEHARRYEDGYTAVQSTKPQTIGYALVDSPAALCAWVGEKYVAWSDGEDLSGLARDDLFDALSTYWFTASGASSARLYWESIETVQGWFTTGTTDVISVPTGCTVFPAETIRPSRRWAERRFSDIRWWGSPPRGGHFPALEVPDLLVDELRGFFATVT
jgi:pimeloyl-ACP methyl ester carboxylesterase